MIIAIDWDGTYTALPELFRQFTNKLLTYGHTVIFVTGRQDTEHHRIEPPFCCPVVYAGNEYKRKAAERAGYKVDIWIDDMPEMIGEGKILNFD